MQIGDAALIELLNNKREQFERITVPNFPVLPEGRQAYAYSIGPNRSCNFINDVQEESNAFLFRPTVGIDALVRPIFQKLLDQMAVCSLYFNSIESSFHRVEGSLPEGSDDYGNFCGFQSTRNLNGHLLEVLCEPRKIGRDRRRGYWQRSSRQQRRMRVSSVVLNLHEHATTAGVHSVCHATPPGNLFGCIDSWRTWVALPLSADRGSLRNDEAG